MGSLGHWWASWSVSGHPGALVASWGRPWRHRDRRGELGRAVKNAYIWCVYFPQNPTGFGWQSSDHLEVGTVTKRSALSPKWTWRRRDGRGVAGMDGAYSE